jgi:hypothetical protein
MVITRSAIGGVLVTFFVGGSWIAACGGGSSTAASPESGDASANDAATLVDAATSDAATSTGGSFLGGYDGLLDFINQADSNDVFSGTFAGGLTAGDACTTPQSFGASCIAITCSPLPLDAGVTYPTAGTLTLTGGIFDAGINVAPVGEGVYAYSQPTATSSFAPGDILGVAASGGAVPAFSQTIVGPGCVTLTPPSMGDAGTSVSTGQDLTLTWSGNEPGAQVFLIAFASPSTPTAQTTQTEIACSFDAALGTGTIPQAALAALNGGTHGVLAWGQYQTKDFVAGSQKMRLMASCQAGVNAQFTP